ncbi:uncharacterized protein TRUGW13939_07759 [Talaromyces rugulosus]|uniref:RGS domain-containing protein n=1 Tax=Talaromyces rugulosus TaxID=121627 RepID=A0A7H8R2K9_TALRU|nr:uncharacterized protein TRUGW13939_07759 [Talaromyces rugulosus]QKX60614.1 hypothetical protein TRUGW13939_07759 [Talaromyces rugulosus]
MTTTSAGNQLPDPPSSSPYHLLTKTPSTTTTTTTAPTPAPIPAGSLSRASRRSIALVAIEKTSNAIANLASRGTTVPASSLRTSTSSASLSKQSKPASSRFAGDETTPLANEESFQTNYRASTTLSRRNTVRLLPRDPTASVLLDTDSSSKMHQTSSRLLRMTEDDRPFTKDFNDLFSTLMVSLKLDTHRVRFTKFEHTFTSDEAINNLGSLKFSQSNRMPDPKDPSRIVTTTTTTTFSMAKEMARSVCQRFVDARFIEPIDSRSVGFFPMKGGLYQLTPKGINILHRFCQRNGITARHVMDVMDSPRNTMQLVNLERDTDTDKLSTDRSTIEVIFRRFAGQDGPNLKSSISSSDSDSLSEYSNGLVGVKMAKERKILDKIHTNTFTGKAATDWLMDCSTTNDRRETRLIAALFIKHGMITAVQEDRQFAQQDPSAVDFQPTKYAIYTVTEHGQRVCGWIARDRSAVSQYDNRGARDSNNARLNHILHDAALRLLFREFLRYSLCEENLSFYVDVSEFTANYHRLEKAGAFNKMDTVRETLAAAYGLYNAFLAPGSPCELNIEHGLRNSLASRMTKAVGNDESMLKSLQEVVNLFELAQTSVFKLMSSDSVPKFVRDPKYSIVLQEHDFDLGSNGRAYSPTPAPVPERSLSRSVRT